MAYDRADSPHAIGGAERKLDVRAPQQERPKLSVEARLEALSNELAGINGLLSGSREIVAQMKADIVETRNGGEDPRDEEQQLMAYLEELEQARVKQKELQKELADLSKPERTELDVMGHALDRAYATGDEAKIQKLEKAMSDEYEKGPIEISKELREERAERAMTPEQKALRSFQGVVTKVEASRKVLYTKPEESRAAAEELREAESEAERLTRLSAEGRNVDKEALKKLQDRLPQLRERSAALSAEVANAHKALFEDEQRAIDLVAKDPQARYAWAEVAKKQAEQQFAQLAKNPAEAKNWLEQTYIPEQLEKQHVLPTLKDLEIEFKRRKALHEAAGRRDYSEEIFARELKSEMSTDRSTSGTFKYREMEYGASFFPPRSENMFASDLAAGVSERNGGEKGGRAAFFAERKKYLDEVIRWFASSSATHGPRYFSGYPLPDHTATKLAEQKMALSEAAKKAIFADWEGSGAFPKQRVFERIAAEETQAAGQRVVLQAAQFEALGEREAELTAQTPKTPDFAERAKAFERSRELDRERAEMMRIADRAGYEAADSFERRARMQNTAIEDSRSQLRDKVIALQSEKRQLEDRIQRGETFIPDAQKWERDAAAKALSQEEQNHVRYRDELIVANLSSEERQPLEARGLMLDYTRLAIANKAYQKAFESALGQLDEEIRKLGKKPEGLFTLKKTVDKWEAQYYPLTRQRTVLKNLLDKFNDEYQAAMKENIEQGEVAVRTKRQKLEQEEAKYTSSQRQIENQRRAQREELAAAKERLPILNQEDSRLKGAQVTLDQEARAEAERMKKEQKTVADQAKQAYLDQVDPKGELRAHVSLTAQAWREEMGKEVDAMIQALALKNKPNKGPLVDTSETVVFSERLARAKQQMTDARAKAEGMRSALTRFTSDNRYGYDRSIGQQFMDELRSKGDEEAATAIRTLARQAREASR